MIASLDLTSRSLGSEAVSCGASTDLDASLGSLICEAATPVARRAPAANALCPWPSLGSVLWCAIEDKPKA